MSYTPTNWQTGDTVTAEKLNKMESGIQTAVDPFIVNLTPTAQDFSGTMDKTGAEITAAYEAGKNIIFRLWESSTIFYDLQVTEASKTASDDVAKFQAFGILTELLVVIQTPSANTNIYETAIYALTPAS
jgi:hypothetical protein